MRPPPEFYDDNNKHIMWKLNKAIYGLRSSPKQWQDHIAEVLTARELTRLKTDSNVYRNKSGTAYIMVYVDDLLFIGEQKEIDILFDKIMKHVLLRPTGQLATGKTITFLRRNITHKGDHMDISLEDDYIDNILKESNMTTCNSAPALGISHPKTTIEDETALDQEQHSAYRRLVRKIQWLAYTRPDISYGAKELVRSLQETQAHDTISQRYEILETRTQTNSTNARKEASNQHRHLHRCELGIMRNNTQEHNRICHTFPGSYNSLWKQNTGNNSPVISRVRAVRNWYSCTTKHLHQQLRQGSFGHKDQRQNTHRQQLG